MRLGIRSVASLCSANDTGRWEFRCWTLLLQVMVLNSGMLLMFDRVLGSDDNQRVDVFRNLSGPTSV